MRETPKIKGAVLFEQQMPDGSIRKMQAYGAYDFTKHPAGNYGIHSMEQLFSLTRGKCAVTLTVTTAMMLQHIRSRERSSQPYASFVWHSPVPQYEDHEVSHHDCSFTGGACYATSSGLRGIEIFDLFVEDPACLWDELMHELAKLEAREQEELALRRNFS